MSRLEQPASNVVVAILFVLALLALIAWSNSRPRIRFNLAPDAGHCAFYTHRPIVCRLFGFAANRNRRGGLELSTCRLIKAEMPEAVSRAVALLAAGELVPSLTAYSARIFGLDPGARLMPINQALGLAMERCGLALTFETPASATDLPRAG